MTEYNLIKEKKNEKLKFRILKIEIKTPKTNQNYKEFQKVSGKFVSMQIRFVLKEKPYTK